MVIYHPRSCRRSSELRHGAPPKGGPSCRTSTPTACSDSTPAMILSRHCNARFVAVAERQADDTIRYRFRASNGDFISGLVGGVEDIRRPIVPVTLVSRAMRLAAVGTLLV